jgi:two-component system sensor histidine kinase HydH
LEIQKKVIPVKVLIDRSLQELEGELSARNIKVEETIAPDLPPLVGDPDKIEGVLVNVLKNAMEASNQAGRIEVSAVTDQRGSSATITIVVVDHGMGISQRNLKIIFQPFFTTKKKGTGLGLAIVQKIMDAHRGKISIESEEGRGTVVKLTFPSVRGAE